jgi:cell wall-associated NlpC family hydrolase
MKWSSLILIPAIYWLSGCTSGKVDEMTTTVTSLSESLVPDKRTDIFDVSVRKGKSGSLVLKGEVTSSLFRDTLLRILSGKHIPVTDSMTVLPDTSALAETKGLITVSVANLRSNPSHSAELVSQALLGTPVEILKKRTGWLFIRTPDRYLSWTNSSSVSVYSDEEFQLWRQSSRLMFTGNYGIVTETPNGTNIITDLVAGSIVVKLAETPGFFQVSLPDKRCGFIRKESITGFKEWQNNAVASCENICSTARRLLGVPYMWGGTSSKALDCSGFVRTVFFLNGIILERDASQQYKYGETVETGENFSNLQPCDLLFFGKKDPLRIVHVGIYLGDKKVINSSGWVQVNSLDKNDACYSDYLFDTYVGSKRLVGLQPQQGYLPVKDHPWY